MTAPRPVDDPTRSTAKTPSSSSTPRRSRKTHRASFGSVRKLASGRYQARYSDAQMHRYAAPHTFATRAAADDWLATVRADMVRGTWRAPEQTPTTLADYAAAHLATRLDLAPRTRETYASVLRHWISRPLDFPAAPGRRPRTVELGSYELRALTVAAVRDWYAAALHTASQDIDARTRARRQRVRSAALHDARAWARANGYAVKDTGRLPATVLAAWQSTGLPAAQAYATALDPEPGQPAPATAQANPPGRAQVAQAYRLLRMVLGHAVREGRIDVNPCQIAGAGQVKASERQPATPEQVGQLADAMPAHLRAAVHLAAWSGLRAGEVFGLARKHLDLDPVAGVGTVRVERAAVYLQHRPPFLGPTKTDASRRTVHLPPHVVRILAAHLSAHTGAEPDALVFTDGRGQIVSRDTRIKAWSRARARVGRPDLRWHDLRHTGATLAAQAGASLRELQHRLGHTTVAAAMIYQHHSADRDRELAARLGQLAHPLPGNVVPLHGEPGTQPDATAGSGTR